MEGPQASLGICPQGRRRAWSLQGVELPGFSSFLSSPMGRSPGLCLLEPRGVGGISSEVSRPRQVAPVPQTKSTHGPTETCCRRHVLQRDQTGGAVFEGPVGTGAPSCLGSGGPGQGRLSSLILPHRGSPSCKNREAHSGRKQAVGVRAAARAKRVGWGRSAQRRWATQLRVSEPRPERARPHLSRR